MDALKSFINKDEQWRFGARSFERTNVYLGAVTGLSLVTLLWASCFEVDRVARMDGKIIPQGHSRPVQHLEGGIVSSISTVEGAFVKEGDLLLTIDATSAGANLNENKSKLMSLRLKAARLKAEASQSKTVEIPQDLAEETSVKGELALFESRRNKLEQEIRTHQESIRQQSAALQEIDVRQKSLEEELIVARKRSQMIGNMVAKRAASQVELLEAQSREKRLDTELGEAMGARPKLKAAVASEQAKAAAIVADFKSQAQGEWVSVSAEIDRLNQAVAAVEDRVKRTDVRAPIGGTVNRVAVTTAGAVVKPGETILEITPTSEQLVLEGRILPKDRGDIQAGINAKVRVSAYDTGKLGVLTGRLLEISADTLQDSRGEPYYRAKVQVDHLPSSYNGHPILPGMTVTADLVAGRRTILSYLLSPLRKFSHTAFRDNR